MATCLDTPHMFTEMYEKQLHMHKHLATFVSAHTWYVAISVVILYIIEVQTTTYGHISGDTRQGSRAQQVQSQ